MPYYGFNFQWMYSKTEAGPQEADVKALDWLVRFNLNFVRLPLDYRFWVKKFDYLNPDERVFARIDRYLEACSERSLHLSLNLHRAPGYCINGNDQERHNLWTDTIAQDGFVYQWQALADRYSGVSPRLLSFDLINEPPHPGQFGMTREIHAALIRRTIKAIRQIDPHREIIIDGLGGGHLAMPELDDLKVVHSGRGYQPMPVSHYGATWWEDSKGLEEPVYPGTKWEGKSWTKDVLHAHYEPWRALKTQVHIGEFGCYNRTPNKVALAWFRDLFSIFAEARWGYAMWNFQGPFGIIRHGRPGARFENLHGYKVDRALLDLFLRHRVADPT